MSINQDKFIGLKLDEKYHIESLIGTGGTGNVYKGTNLQTGSPIAIKILHQSLSFDEIEKKRFRLEANLTMAVKHPNVLAMMDFGIFEDRIFYIIMEYISGISLGDLINNEQRLSIPRAIELMKQICQAVNEAHHHGILHRDLKPENIMILDCGEPGETVKVIDFSIAKMVANPENENLTADGQVLGTPQYLSPEQAQGLPLSAGSDIYSLGIILYEMITGTLPFNSKTPTGFLMKHIHNTPRPPRQLSPEIPPKLEEVILKTLAKEPVDRPKTAAELATLIEEAFKSGNEIRKAASDATNKAAIIGATGSNSSKPAKIELPVSKAAPIKPPAPAPVVAQTPPNAAPPPINPAPPIVEAEKPGFFKRLLKLLFG